jgi:HAD superfamily hydrolase (TIGR01548 family)
MPVLPKRGSRPTVDHMLPVDAILFDMDGTLIDESKSYREAIRLTAAHILQTPVTRAEVEEIKAIPGFNNDWDAAWGVIAVRCGEPAVPPSEEQSLSEEYLRLQDVFQTYYLGSAYWAEISGHPAPFEWSEGLIAREAPLISLRTLEALSPFALGIATSRPRLEALLALCMHGLEPFFALETVVAAEDAPHEKPHPAPLMALAERLGARAPVYVGDTINDALAAAAARMPFIQVGSANFDETERSSVFVRLESVNELPDVCRVVGSL